MRANLSWGEVHDAYHLFSHKFWALVVGGKLCERFFHAKFCTAVYEEDVGGVLAFREWSDLRYRADTYVDFLEVFDCRHEETIASSHGGLDPLYGEKMALGKGEWWSYTHRSSFASLHQKGGGLCSPLNKGDH